jgi:hypothetical protein
MTITLRPDTNELREIATLPTESALLRAARFLSDLVKDTGFRHAEILPLVGKAKNDQGWYVARQYDGEDDSYSLKIFVWPAGTGTRSTITPPGAPTPAPSVPSWRSATTASTTARWRSTPA